MKKGFLLASITLLSACSEVDSLKPFDNKQAAILIKQWYVKKPAQQRISIALPQKQNWKRIDLSMTNQGTPIMLVPLNETSADWTQSIRTDINPYSALPDMNAELYVQNAFSKARTECAHSSVKILSQTQQFVTYEMKSHGCRKDILGTQIGKAFNGRDAVYLVNYSAVSGRVNEAEITRMSRVILNAELVRNPRTDL